MVNEFICLLRGIGPGNPNMRPEKLKQAFIDQGFENVSTVLGTGNVIFSANFKSTSMLEHIIEEMLTKRLGLTNRAIVRSKGDIKRLIESNPFGELEDIPTARFHVTFPKVTSALKNVPDTFQGQGFTIVKKIDNCIISLSDTVHQSTPALMSYLEKHMGKDVTTRTWKTIHRIAVKFTHKN